jgi:large subunit ribosomal protein L40e
MVSFAGGADAPLAPNGANSQTVPIFVKSMSGLTITVNVTLSETIASVKAKVAEILSQFSVYRQRLVYAGRDMQDDHTLSYYDIKSESTVHVIGRLMVDCTPVQPITWPVQRGEEATAELVTCTSAGALCKLVSVEPAESTPVVCLPLFCQPSQTMPDVGASLWVRRCDGVFLFVKYDTRQSAVDYLSSHKLHEAIPGYTVDPTAENAATSECPQIFMGGSGGHQVILVRGTTPPAAEKLFNLFGQPPKMTKTLLLKPSELMTFINFPWEEIATVQIEDHLYRLAGADDDVAAYAGAAATAPAPAAAAAATAAATATAAAATARPPLNARERAKRSMAAVLAAMKRQDESELDDRFY